jgi:copper homeostasis protein
VSVLVEAAVESLEDALAAIEGGADRLELCGDLGVGGITPDESLIAEVVDLVSIPVYVMIRPRGGSFVYTTFELDEMRHSIDRVRELGVDGVVLGVLSSSNRVDVIRTQSLVDAAAELPITFHRAFDRVEDQIDALDTLIDLGIVRVLTSGGAPTAIEGARRLEDLLEHADGRISILAGGGVREENVRDLVERTGVIEVHARCEENAARIRAIKAAATGEE